MRGHWFESCSWGAIAVTRIAFCFKSNVFPIISCNLLFERNTWWTVLLDSPIAREEDIVDVQKAFKPLFMVYFGNDFMLNTLKLDDFGTTDVEDFLSMSWIETIRTRDPVTDRTIKSAKVNTLFSRIASTFLWYCKVSFRLIPASRRILFEAQCNLRGVVREQPRARECLCDGILRRSFRRRSPRVRTRSRQ